MKSSLRFDLNEGQARNNKPLLLPCFVVLEQIFGDVKKCERNLHDSMPAGIASQVAPLVRCGVPGFLLNDADDT